MVFGQTRLNAVDGVYAQIQTEETIEISCDRVLRNTQLNHLINNKGAQISAPSALPGERIEPSFTFSAHVTIKQISDYPALDPAGEKSEVVNCVRESPISVHNTRSTD
jgi:hypothetical protein